MIVDDDGQRFGFCIDRDTHVCQNRVCSGTVDLHLLNVVSFCQSGGNLDRSQNDLHGILFKENFLSVPESVKILGFLNAGEKFIRLNQCTDPTNDLCDSSVTVLVSRRFFACIVIQIDSELDPSRAVHFDLHSKGFVRGGEKSALFRHIILGNKVADLFPGKNLEGIFLILS